VDLHAAGAADARFRAYASEVASVLGRADRVKPFEDYCIGLISAAGRKSVELLPAVTAPERTAAQHQSLLHLVAQAPWSDAAILRRVRECVLPSVTREEPIQAWIIDDTGYPKKGRHSVGVARQYCGQVGKQENCQTAVSLSIATHQASLPVAYRLYLPKEWADDAARRSKAGVPEDVTFQPSPRLHCSRCVRRWSMACRRPWHWPIRRMATTAVFALGSLNSGWLTRSVSCPPRRSGRPARHRCRRPVPAVAGVPHGSAATRGLSWSRSRRWPCSFPSMPGSRCSFAAIPTRARIIIDH
jgi:DDE superfamily endonuclease